MLTRLTASLLSLLLLATTACSDSDAATTLTVYSGRSQVLVEPLFEQFTAATGIEVEVRYANSTDLAATLREEGTNSPADVFFAQDPASLGAVAESGLFAPLSQDLLGLVPSIYSDGQGRWVGTSGRARVIVFDGSRLDAADLPTDVTGFTDPAWRGRLGVAPGNGSFLAFVATMILMQGEDATQAWLDGIAANGPQKYEKNSAIVAAVDGGEIEVGLVNHYYLLRLRAEQGEAVAENHFLANAGPGSLVMPAGAGIIATSNAIPSAKQFIEFLLSEEAQQFFATETFEYPLVPGIAANSGLPGIETLNAPAFDLSALATALSRATDLVAAAGLL